MSLALMSQDGKAAGGTWGDCGGLWSYSGPIRWSLAFSDPLGTMTHFAFPDL